MVPSTFCSTWWMWPLSTVTEPYGRSSASACAESAVPQHHDRGGIGDLRQVGFHPRDLLVAERGHGAHLEVEHVVQADEMHAVLVEAVISPALAVVVEVLEVAADTVIDRVVLAGNGVHVVMELLQHLAR